MTSTGVGPNGENETEEGTAELTLFEAEVTPLLKLFPACFPNYYPAFLTFDPAFHALVLVSSAAVVTADLAV